jgi:glycosyltransferase involved in cell wall biosynthesis
MQTIAASCKIAVLLPCYNEALVIRQVVQKFREVIPSARIYVYDNNSSDNTISEARAAGAIVRKALWPGKGNVVRRMFADIEADVYLMADGDGTYDAMAAPQLIFTLLENRLDMVVGTRKNIYENAYRFSHGFGNKLFNGLYRAMFGRLFNDIFSGYRVFSRRFVKSFPAISSGFEIETEISIHTSQLRMPIAEIATSYGKRQEGSVSKLHTVRDALRILKTLIVLFKEVYPLRFYGILAAGLSLLAFALSLPLLFTYIETGLVPRLPTAILVTGMVLLSAICMVCGLILDSLARSRLEQKSMWYLASSKSYEPEHERDRNERTNGPAEFGKFATGEQPSVRPQMA